MLQWLHINQSASGMSQSCANGNPFSSAPVCSGGACRHAELNLRQSFSCWEDKKPANLKVERAKNHRWNKRRNARWTHTHTGQFGSNASNSALGFFSRAEDHILTRIENKASAMEEPSDLNEKSHQSATIFNSIQFSTILFTVYCTVYHNIVPRCFAEAETQSLNVLRPQIMQRIHFHFYF